MDCIHCYYYLHENGQVIWKSARVTDNDPDYFVSPFVKKVWEIRTSEDLMGLIAEINEKGYIGPVGGIYW